MSGLLPETPYSLIESALAGTDEETLAIGGDREPLTVDCLRIDRSAIVKFKKAGDVSFEILSCIVLYCVLCCCIVLLHPVLSSLNVS